MAAPPATETPTEARRTKRPEAPGRARELHPQSAGPAGPRAVAGMGGRMSAPGLGSQRRSQVANLQSMHGNQGVLKMLHPSRPVAGLLQRKCACGGTPGPDGECTACKVKRLSRQRQAGYPAEPADAPPIVHDVLRSPGQPLDASARAFLEPRLGQDFTNVRVHTDARAAESARTVDALAYTVGTNVVFGAGQYTPGTVPGRRLLAHELVHAIQQGHHGDHHPRSLAIGSPRDPAEAEAEQVARAVTVGGAAEPTRRGTQQISRQTSPSGPASAPPGPAPAHPTPGPSASPQPTFGKTCTAGANDPCQITRCTPQQPGIVAGDLARAIRYVDAAIAALNATPLASDTNLALRWFFTDASEATAMAVRTRLGCIRDCLRDTQNNNRYACDPDDAIDLAYVCVGAHAICADVQTNVCLASKHWAEEDRVRAEVMIHECAHRVGMSLGKRTSVPDIYQWTQRFQYLDTSEAIQNSDSFALFAGSITEGIQVTFPFTMGVAGGIALPGVGASQAGPATWYAQIYLGTEFQHPVLGLFNPTLGLGISAIGDAPTGNPAVPSSTSVLYSLLAGVRIGNARPGAAGGGYVSLFGGPSLALGATTGIGGEAGFAGGYRWRWLDVSAGIGYAYDPTRQGGLQNVLTPRVGLTFIPSF